MADILHRPTLDLVRVPGEFGPVVRCSGELVDATMDALKAELELLEPLAHPVLTVNLAECRHIDVTAILTILNSFKRRIQEGRRLVLVAGTGLPRRLLTVAGIDWIIPVFPTEESAALALRGGGPPSPAPATWAAARDAAVARWRVVEHALEHAPHAEVLHLLTGMSALCERSQALYESDSSTVETRCQFCPLYWQLGGRTQDVGCQSMLNPIIEAIQGSDAAAARARVQEVIRTLESMPLPEEGYPPVPGLIGQGL